MRLGILPKTCLGKQERQVREINRKTRQEEVSELAKLGDGLSWFSKVRGLREEKGGG